MKHLAALAAVSLATSMACGSPQQIPGPQRVAKYSVTTVRAAFAKQGIRLRKEKVQLIPGYVVLSNDEKTRLVNVGIRVAKVPNQAIFGEVPNSPKDRLAKQENVVVAYSTSEAHAVGAALATLAQAE